MQHVILRKDLTKKPFSWPAGSQIAQACHVVSKTLWELREEPNVKAYMADMDNMHKVTLAAKDEDELRGVIASLSEQGLNFRRCTALSRARPHLEGAFACMTAAYRPHPQYADDSLPALRLFPVPDTHSWVEQPEGILTAVATMPYPRDVTSPHLKHLSLYR